MGTSSFVLSPTWPHLLGIVAIALSVSAGLARHFLLDWSDPIRCNALLSQGSWLDGTTRRNWQPDGCMLHSYKPPDAFACLKSKPLIFIGDSIVRILFFQLSHILDPSLPVSPLDTTEKHSDHTFYTNNGNKLSFFWDPFLNSSRTLDVLRWGENETEVGERPAILVLGSGLWYLRHANTSGGLPSWEANVERIFDLLKPSHIKPADEIVMLPIEQVIMSKLNSDRATSMRSSDVDAMNSYLFHRINTPHDTFPIFSSMGPSLPVVLPIVFNKMLDPSQTDDGLHFSHSLVRLQATILLNLRCNDLLPKRFPLDKTCCNHYPWPSALQFIILGFATVLGPVICFVSSRPGQRYSFFRTKDIHWSILLFSAGIAITFVADRTSLWLKEQKQFNAWIFGFLCILFLAVGLATIKRADKDLGFLNRDQTDEWKGWMQIAILIYHYCGASKVSGIYNPIRVLVASYLFMTGYGHTTFYLKKADFGFLRIAQVMIRLNLLTLLLAYTMNTDYISYYFSPLVSMWFLIIYATMAVGSWLNDRMPFLICKILLSAGLVTWFMREAWLLENLLDFLGRVCGIHWSAREWAFRVNLDLWIVYVGMFAAIATIKVREHRLTDHPYWPVASKLAMVMSGACIVWFFTFELYQDSKFTYNPWHPYISFIPILAFVVLRNASVVLRSASSWAFAFVGRCSLETFIIQYHLWLAGDTKGILLVIPGTRWRSLNFVITTVMFIYVSDRMAHATTQITSWICETPKSPQLPMANSPSSNHHLSEDANVSIPLLHTNNDQAHKDDESNLQQREPDTPVRARPWVDRLAEGSTQTVRRPGFLIWSNENSERYGLKTKLIVATGIMWIVNMMWSY